MVPSRMAPDTVHPTSQFQRERLEDENLNSSRDAPSLADELFEWVPARMSADTVAPNKPISEGTARR